MIFQYMFFFFVYSFAGWCLEVIFAAIRKRKFVNRGLLNSMFCPSYGFSMVFLLFFFRSLKDRVVFLFLASFIVIALMEYITGKLFEKLFDRKCWDYSHYKDHIGSYVCLHFSLAWSLTAVLTILFLQPLLDSFWNWMPLPAGKIITGILSVLILIDAIVTFATFKKIKLQNEKLWNIARKMKKVSHALDNAITRHVEKRMEKIYPSQEMLEEEKERKRQEKEAKKQIFAYGCGFYKLFCLFFLGAFLGDIVETIFCLITTGRLMSRSSVVYGPFSIVWGMGIAFFTLLLHRYRSSNDRYLFLLGTVLGGAYEYVCSVFTEIVFGTVFWDYSKIPFNLGGRINLLYCFFWGFAAVVWMKGLYPVVSRWLEKIPIKIGKVLSWIFFIFMVFNVLVSAMALGRYSDRNNGIAAQNEVEEYLDEHFDDARMERIYPNAIHR